MTKYLSYLFFLIPLFSWAQSQVTEKGFVSEDSDELIYYSADFINADLMTEEAALKGNVKIIFGSYELNAKNATISKKTQILKAWGDVRIEGNNSFIEAEKATLNYKTEQGTIEDVRITSGQLLLEAKRLYKISEEVYRAEKAELTTCLTCPAAWRIKSKNIITNVNSYVTIKGGRLQILDQTVLPLPNLTLPLNTRRKTGLLAPDIENSTGNSGVEFGLPYFWAIDPHRDFTFTPKLYFGDKFSKVQGAKLHTEYNQWLSKKSNLKLDFAFMYDGSYLDVNKNLDPSSRWFINYSNFFVLPNDIIQKSKLTLVREREYLNDFISEVAGRGEASLKNSFSISKINKNKFTSLEIVYHTNLLTEDPFDDNNTSIQKLPEINHSIAETPVLGGRALFKSNVAYTNFFRNSKNFDEISPNTTSTTNSKDVNLIEDGFYNPDTDLLRTGHRLRLNAVLSAPFKIGKTFDVLPLLNYRDSYYKFNLEKDRVTPSSNGSSYSPFSFSRYLEAGLSFRTELSKVLNKKYKHKIIPELNLRLGTNIHRNNSSFFDSQGDLPYHRKSQPITDEDFFDYRHGVQFDYWDRFFRAEVAEFSLTNLLIKKNFQDFITYYDQPFYFNLTQSYDFRNARISAQPDPWSNLDGRLKIQIKNFSNLTQSSYFYKSKRLNISTRSKFTYLPGRFLAFGYSDFITVDAQGALTNNRTKNVNLEIGWEFKTLKVSGTAAYSLLEKKHLGWSTHLFYTPPGNCWGLKTNFFKLNNRNELGFKAGFFFNYGPNPSTQKPLFNI